MTKNFAQMCLACLLLTFMDSQAQVNWINAAGGNWADDAGWNTGTAPVASDAVLHTRVGGTISVATTAEANQLNVSHSGTAVVKVGKGGSLTVGGNSEIGNAGEAGVGRLVVDGGSVVIGGNIEFGKYGPRQGEGELNSGSMTVNGVTSIGGFNADSQGTLTINGGTYTATGGVFQIGRAGSGMLTVNGGVLRLDTSGGVWNPLRVGDDATGDAFINLNGGSIITSGMQMDYAEEDAGAATINLNAGVLQIEGRFPAALRVDDNAMIVFDEGLLKWAGNRIPDLAALVESGVITWNTSGAVMPTELWDTSYTNGNSVLYVDSDDANPGYTTVWAASSE